MKLEITEGEDKGNIIINNIDATGLFMYEAYLALRYQMEANSGLTIDEIHLEWLKHNESWLI